MVGPEPVSGEASIIVQLNRQDVQQRAQKQADEAPANSENVKSPTQAERLYGEKDIIPAVAARDDGADKEPENNNADRGNVTETRGQNVNLLA